MSIIIQPGQIWVKVPRSWEIEGCPPKPENIDISVNTREYAPTAGRRDLREAVANLYNVSYRQGKSSQYT